MKKSYISILLAFVGFVFCAAISLLVWRFVKDLSFCEQRRFNDLALDEFREANQVDVAKIVVDFYNDETIIEVSEPEKIKLAMNFMQGRQNNWQQSCIHPVRALIGLSFYDDSGNEIGYYGFWSHFIVVYTPRGLNQSDLPPILFQPIKDEKRESLFRGLGIPNELINKRLGLDKTD